MLQKQNRWTTERKKTSPEIPPILHFTCAIIGGGLKSLTFDLNLHHSAICLQGTLTEIGLFWLLMGPHFMR